MNDEPKRDNYIRLAQPLFWKTAAGTGEVLAVSPSTLILRSGSPLPLPAQLEITIPWGPERNFVMGGAVHTHEPPHTYRFELSDNGATELCTNLRKVQHIELCQREDVEAKEKFTGFSELHFIPQALPELDFAQLNIEREFLGRRWAAPFLITGMTGGIKEGAAINRTLARTAVKFNIPMGIGSQRIALENSDYRNIFIVKDEVPDVFLIGNVGFTLLREPNYLELCRAAVEMVHADALAIHLNVVQECIQVEGQRNFTGILERIKHVCADLPVPVMIKEVGSGIAPETASQLVNAGVAAIDVSGRGGTSWPYIEGKRGTSTNSAQLGTAFREWGIPTAYALHAVRKRLPNLPLVATGGMRDGQTAAKAIAIGADMVGVGLPLLRAALESQDRAHNVMDGLITGLKITMVATGSRGLEDLRKHLCYGIPYADEFAQSFSLFNDGERPAPWT